MRISTEIDSAAKIVGEHKAVELIAKAGFDAWDFSMYYMDNVDWKNSTLLDGHPLASTSCTKLAKELRDIGLDNGIVCNQSHAPFPLTSKSMIDYAKRAIECTSIAGGKVCIIHPNNYLCAEKNAEIYLELLPVAKDYDVKIATENMWLWDKEKDEALKAACSHHNDFLKHIEVINDPYLIACLDIGHAEMRGLNTSSVEMIHTLGKHLQALHIHDNDKWHDTHQIPFSMNIDFEEIVKALKEINYQGDFTLEAISYLNGYTSQTLPGGLKDMANAARRLADMFERA